MNITKRTKRLSAAVVLVLCMLTQSLSASASYSVIGHSLFESLETWDISKSGAYSETFTLKESPFTHNVSFPEYCFTKSNSNTYIIKVDNRTSNTAYISVCSNKNYLKSKDPNYNHTMSHTLIDIYNTDQEEYKRFTVNPNAYHVFTFKGDPDATAYYIRCIQDNSPCDITYTVY